MKALTTSLLVHPLAWTEVIVIVLLVTVQVFSGPYSVGGREAGVQLNFADPYGSGKPDGSISRATAVSDSASVLLLALAVLLALLLSPSRVPRRYRALLRDCRDPTSLACAALLPLLLAPALISSGDAPAMALRAGATALLLAVGCPPRLAAILAACAACVAAFGGRGEIFKDGAVTAVIRHIIIAAALPMIADSLLRVAPKSFSFSEAILTAGMLCGAINFLFGSGSSAKQHVIDSGVQATRPAILASVLIAAFLLPLALYFQTCAEECGPGKLPIYPEIVLSACFMLVVFVTYVYARYFVLLEEPVSFIFQYIFGSGPASKSRCVLTVYWLVLLAIVLTIYPPHSLPVSRIVARKAYHFLAAALFFPALYIDAPFLGLSMAVALVLMLLVEAARVCGRCGRAGIAVDRLTRALIDERDVGPFVLTHIYLLVGCAWPVWLAAGTSAYGPFGVRAAGGVLALGVLDAVASVVGSAAGKICWPKSKKTIEGTVAASAVCSIVAIAWAALVGALDRPAAVFRIIVTVSFAAVFEACTSQIDNLVLPLMFVGACSAFMVP